MKYTIQEKSAKLFGKASHHRPIVSENEVGELWALLVVLLQGTEYGIEGAEQMWVDHWGWSLDWDNGNTSHHGEKLTNKAVVLSIWAASTLEASADTSLLHKECISHPIDLLGKVLQQRCCLDNSLPCAFYTWTEITSEICSPWAGFSKRCLTWHLLSQNYLCFAQTGGQSASFMSWTLRKDGLECPLMFYSVLQTMIKLFCVLFCANYGRIWKSGLSDTVIVHSCLLFSPFK